MTKNALVFLAPGFEEIEAVTAIDILRRAGVSVTVAGVDALCVTGSHQLTLVADTTASEVSGAFDACILPGGMPGASHLAASPHVQCWLKNLNTSGKLIAAICAAPAVVLAPAGILKNRSATCFTGMEDHFSAEVRFIDQPVVVDKNIITSQGAGTAFAFSLAIVAYLLGKSISEKIRKSTLADQVLAV